MTLASRPENSESTPFCGICTSTGPHKLIGAPSASLPSSYYRCSACASIFLFPLPPVETNEAFETETAAQKRAATDALRAHWLRRKLDLLGPPSPGATLLDVGCGAGQVLQLAGDAGWQATGVELSESLATIARQNAPGATIIQEDIIRINPAAIGQFDAIIALDILEHVLDPAAFVGRLRALLRHGGRLVLHTPNASSLRARLQGRQWNMLIPEYHFHLFAPAALDRLLRSAGFTKVRLTTSSGTGLEAGLAARLAGPKESLLRLGGLGNALLVIAE